MFVSGMNPFSRWSFRSRFLARTARRDPLDQLAGHAVERASSAEHFRCCSPLVSFHSSWPAAFWNFPRTPRSRPPGAVSDEFITGHSISSWASRNVRNPRRTVFLVSKTLGRRLNESLGKLHFWLTFAGVYLVFMPMHWLGLLTARQPLTPGSGIAAIGCDSRAVRAFNSPSPRFPGYRARNFSREFFVSLFRGQQVKSATPGARTTLEWNVSSPPPADDIALSTRWCIVGLRIQRAGRRRRFRPSTRAGNKGKGALIEELEVHHAGTPQFQKSNSSSKTSAVVVAENARRR